MSWSDLIIRQDPLLAFMAHFCLNPGTESLAIANRCSKVERWPSNFRELPANRCKQWSRAMSELDNQTQLKQHEYRLHYAHFHHCWINILSFKASCTIATKIVLGISVQNHTEGIVAVSPYSPDSVFTVLVSIFISKPMINFGAPSVYYKYSCTYGMPFVSKLFFFCFNLQSTNKYNYTNPLWIYKSAMDI